MTISPNLIVHSRGDDCGNENQLEPEEIELLQQISTNVLDFINKKEDWGEKEERIRTVIQKPGGNNEIMDIRSSQCGTPFIGWGWTPKDASNCSYLSTSLMENGEMFNDVSKYLHEKIDIVLINKTKIKREYDWVRICKWLKKEFEQHLHNRLTIQTFESESELDEILQMILDEQNERGSSFLPKKENIICRSIHIFSPLPKEKGIGVDTAFSNIICENYKHENMTINSITTIHSLAHVINDSCLGLFLTIVAKIIGAFESSSYSQQHDLSKAVRYHYTALTKHRFLSTTNYPPIIMNAKEHIHKFDNHAAESNSCNPLSYYWPPKDLDNPSVLSLYLDNIDEKMYGSCNFPRKNREKIRDFWEDERTRYTNITKFICEYTNWKQIPTWSGSKTDSKPGEGPSGEIVEKLWDIWDDKTTFNMFKNYLTIEGEDNRDFVNCDNYDSTWMGDDISSLLRILNFFKTTYDEVKKMSRLSQQFAHSEMMNEDKEIKQFCQQEGCDFNILEVRIHKVMKEIPIYLGIVNNFFKENNVNNIDGRDSFLFKRYSIDTLVGVSE